MIETAFWRRLDVPGHDAARIAPTAGGWRLAGTAVFCAGPVPACLGYVVDLDADWRTTGGRIRGFRGAAEVEHVFERRDGDWRLDGRLQRGLADLVDLDLGFTPSTNFQQLRRLGLPVGASAGIRVAWFDLGETALTELPQRYHRLDAGRYEYESPTAGYRAVLEMAENGFVRNYPQLWVMEACGRKHAG